MFSKLFLGLFVISFWGCALPKKVAEIPLNTVDSLVRTIVPQHNCGCNWDKKTTKLYEPGSLKNYSSYVLNVFITDSSTVDLLEESKSIAKKLKNYNSAFSNYARFAVSYYFVDTAKGLQNRTYLTMGVWLQFNNGCNGLVKGIDSKKAIKQSFKKEFVKQFCD
jgi:hypothetical protein